MRGCHQPASCLQLCCGTAVPAENPGQSPKPSSGRSWLQGSRCLQRLKNLASACHQLQLAPRAGECCTSDLTWSTLNVCCSAAIGLCNMLFKGDRLLAGLSLMEASSVVCSTDSRALQNLGMMYRQVCKAASIVLTLPSPSACRCRWAWFPKACARLPAPFN